MELSPQPESRGGSASSAVIKECNSLSPSPLPLTPTSTPMVGASIRRLKELEEEQGELNEMLLRLSTRFSQVQFRIQQIMQTPDEHERSRMLQELQHYALTACDNSTASTSSPPSPVRRQASGSGSSGCDNIAVFQREERERLVWLLESQLSAMESYACANTVDVRALRRRRIVIDQLRGSLHVRVDDLNCVTADELRRDINDAIEEMSSQRGDSEQLTRQLQQQGEDLERFIAFMQEQLHHNDRSLDDSLRPSSQQSPTGALSSLLSRWTGLFSGCLCSYQPYSSSSYGGSGRGSYTAVAMSEREGSKRKSKKKRQKKQNAASAGAGVVEGSGKVDHARVAELNRVRVSARAAAGALFPPNASLMRERVDQLHDTCERIVALLVDDFEEEEDEEDVKEEEEEEERWQGGSRERRPDQPLHALAMGLSDTTALDDTDTTTEVHIRTRDSTTSRRSAVFVGSHWSADPARLVRSELALHLAVLFAHGLKKSGHAYDTFQVFYHCEDGDSFIRAPAQRLSLAFEQERSDEGDMSALVTTAEPATQREMRSPAGLKRKRKRALHNSSVDSGSASMGIRESLLAAVWAIDDTHDPYKRTQDTKWRALVCSALNQHRLYLWCNLLADAHQLVERLYHPWAYIRTTRMREVIEGLALLNQLPFHLDVNAELRSFAKYQCEQL